MKHKLNQSVRRLVGAGFLCLLALSFSLSDARARTITLSLEFTRFQFSVFDPYDPGQTYYTVKTLVSSDVPPITYDEVDSSTNNSAFGGSENGYGYGYYGDLGFAINAATNGVWTLTVNKGDASEKQYTFTVSASGLDNTSFPTVQITTPVDGNPAVSTNSAFAWTGPAAWNELDLDDHTPNYSFYVSDSPSAATTSWNAAPLPLDTNIFEVTYKTNAAAWIAISTPLDNLSHPFTNWAGGAKLVDYAQSEFVTSTNPPPTLSGGHTLIAHYAFDNSGNEGMDSSGNGNDFDCSSSWGPGQVFSTNSIAGGGALQFLGGTSLTPCGQDQSFISWTNALAGSFTVSAWIKTTNVVGNDGDSLGDYNGQSVVYADNNNLGATPVALTGTKAAFRTTDPNGNDDTLHSLQSVTTGNYVHIVATRDQATGEKKIYINGTLDNADFASTEALTGAQYISIGGESGSAYQGLVDDVQIYSGVLSDSEVVYLDANPGATVANVSVNSGGHLIVARFNFEDTNSPGMDSSGHGNDSNCGGGDGTTNYPDIFSTDAAVGSYSRDFLGHSFICFTPPAGSFTNLANALSGSFSVSAWVKTTQSVNDDNANADAGANILFAEDANTNSTVPLALTGSKAAFSVNDHNGNTTTVHSLTSVNDGQYHQLAVTRNQASGLLKIYVDGNLEGSASGTTDPLYINSIIALGGYFNYYTGLLDDVQIYSGVLGDADVAGLFANPGSTVPDVADQDFNVALGTTNLNWSTSGATSWFVETTNTYNGAPAAAQSGSVTYSQTSTLSTIVTGPGTLTFYWSSIANDPNQGFDCKFYLDNDPNFGDMADLYNGVNPWVQAGPFAIPAGQHTLSWTVFPNGDTDPTQAGFLDQVSYVVTTAPVITLNPFDQTNYPGYNVALFAAATSNPTATWQWFKVGPGLIPNATNTLYIPTNSGTAGVAGNYYAVASNPSGSAITLTAAVTFVSGPLPPDWSHVFRSPFYSANNTAISDYNGGCAVDPVGDVYVANQYIGSVNIENSQAAIVKTLTAVGANGGAALVKYANTNVALNASPLVWAVGLTNNDPASYSYAHCVALAPGNGAYLASVLVGTNWLGTNKFSNNGGFSVLLSRFDASGSNLWSRLIGQTNQVFVIGYNDLVSDASGNVTVAGVMNGAADFGGIVLTATGYMGFMAQYNSNGVVRWAQVFPGSPLSMASDGRQIYVATSAFTSGGVTNISLGNLSTLTDRAYGIGAVNAATGQALWLNGAGEQYGANGVNDVPLISVAGSDVFLTGTANGVTAVFGNLSVSLTGGSGQYFARYDTNGNPQVATTFGSPTTMSWASAANASGVYISGDFDNYSDFGNFFVTAPEYAPSYLGAGYFTQPFVAKFDRNGNPLWARYGVSPVLANFRGIATTSDGVWASGFLDVTTDSNDNIVPAQFGTNSIISDSILVGSPFGSFVFSRGGFLAKITETTAATPVTLLNLQTADANFQFQFLSQAGFSHSILYRTNLAVGIWQTNSTVTGDGTLKTISLPFSLFSPAKQGFVRVSTQ